jgi:hypothetical protein
MAQYEELTIDQGSDVSIELHLVNPDGSVKDLDGYTVTAKMKRTYNSDSDNTTSFVTTIPDAGAGLTVLSLTNDVTDNLRPGRYVYDVEISFQDSNLNTIIERVMEGNIEVTRSVTR